MGGQPREILADWVNALRTEDLGGNDDPIFPSTRIELGQSGQWEANGIQRKHSSNAGPIRAILKSEVLESAGLPYFNPPQHQEDWVRLGQLR
jgi:hypothetical protein